MSAPMNFISSKSAGLIERDTNGDVLWTWSYPNVSEEERNFFLQKSQLTMSTDGIIPFIYSQWRRNWYYIKTYQVTEEDHLSRVTHFSLVLVTKDFNPEKYEVLCKILCMKYRKTGNPASMLELYLHVLTRGSCATDENGRFSVRDFDVKRAFINSKIKDIVTTFGLETILIYTALLLKKRIAVYYPQNQLEDLLQFIRSLPAFVWHRQNWDIAYPYVELDSTELEDLSQKNSFVAGFTDASIEGRTDLYDIFVNPSTSQITTATHAKESFAMGKLHKDTAMFMVQCAEKEDVTDEQLIKEIASKTRELINNLKSLSVTGEDSKQYITIEVLRERKMTPATENFLFSLAACEGLVQM
ncbi:DENN domain-containing protein 10-like [Mytilus californianus]|uniref:DENN domain-containing protein 10-like n=1 Tax=Mytilus californianus TaxID=6549 RepID=UPI002247568D|nr:DENN domain-containing protein 10-like [Mytilus californianus]